MDEIEILKKIQNECRGNNVCRECTYYKKSLGCILQSSPASWLLNEPITCNDCIHATVCYKVKDGISLDYAEKCIFYRSK